MCLIITKIKNPVKFFEYNFCTGNITNPSIQFRLRRNHSGFYKTININNQDNNFPLAKRQIFFPALLWIKDLEYCYGN